jgi:orotate phosphoribosyltransferase
MWLHKDQIIEKLYQGKIILKKGSDYPEGFILKSGKQSDIYINLRDLIKTPTIFNLTMFWLHNLVANKYSKANSCVMGVPTMGAVMAPIIAYKLGMPQAVIRQKNKDHGVGSAIEGRMLSRIALIDDVITSGSSVTEIIQNYIEPVYGADYELDVFVIVDREQHSMQNVHSLVKLSDIEQWKPSRTKKG